MPQILVFFFVIFSDITVRKGQKVHININLSQDQNQDEFVGIGTSLEQVKTKKNNKLTSCYSHISISSGSKCFSQVYTLSFFICSLKSASISLVFFISPSHSSRHLLWASSFAKGSFQIPIPFVLRHDPQPKTEQL